MSVFVFKQKTAYEMRISDWSSDVCSSDLFEGVPPPVSLAPCFSIRKPAARIYTLLDYVKDGIMPVDTARLLSMAVVERRNILVAGGTSSGKTTLANALLAEKIGRAHV